MGRRRWVNGRPRSMNAEIAESYGRMPITRAVEAVYRDYNCPKHRITRKAVRNVLERHWDGEWHHVGPYAHEIGYYDTTLSFAQLREVVSSKKSRVTAQQPLLDRKGNGESVNSR